MVLKILKEMLQHQSERFMPYVELTILRLLEFEKDTDKEVSSTFYRVVHKNVALYFCPYLCHLLTDF